MLFNIKTKRPNNKIKITEIKTKTENIKIKTNLKYIKNYYSISVILK